VWHTHWKSQRVESRSTSTEWRGRPYLEKHVPVDLTHQFNRKSVPKSMYESGPLNTSQETTPAIYFSTGQPLLLVLKKRQRRLRVEFRPHYHETRFKRKQPAIVSYLSFHSLPNEPSFDIRDRLWPKIRSQVVTKRPIRTLLSPTNGRRRAFKTFQAVTVGEKSSTRMLIVEAEPFLGRKCTLL